MDIHNTRFSSLICTILHFYLLIGKIKKWTKNQGFRFETVLLSIFKQIMYHMIHALKTDYVLCQLIRQVYSVQGLT